MTPKTVKSRFQKELDLLQARLMEMAGLAEELVNRAVKAFFARNTEAASLLRVEDGRIDSLEVEVDERVMGLIALHQPVASDLRQILTTLKISNDIERVGDHGVNVAKAARRLAGLPPSPIRRRSWSWRCSPNGCYGTRLPLLGLGILGWPGMSARETIGSTI